MKKIRHSLHQHITKHFYSICIFLALVILIIIQLTKSTTQNISPVKIALPKNISSESASISPLIPIGKDEHITLDNTKSYFAIFHTPKGDITVHLNVKVAPITVRNFVLLAQNKYYDETPMYPVDHGFMIQDEGPNGDNSGGPGYRYLDDALSGEYAKEAIIVSNPSPNSNRRQFFILQKNAPMREYFAEFGTVTQGLEIISAIKNSNRDHPIKLSSIEIMEK